MSPDPAITEELTAYLDGELQPAEVLRVEQRLNADPAYLAEMQSLQKTWDLFEQLPNQHADDSFVKTTMELVVQEARQQPSKKRQKAWVWPLRLMALSLLPLVFFAAGFATTRMIKMAPHRELISNLALIENFEQYKSVNFDLSFLTKMEQWGLFAEDNTYPVDLENELPTDWFVYDQKNGLPSRETTEQRLERIQAMSVKQKNELNENYQEYQKLTDLQKQEVIQFHNELSNHMDRTQLIHVMNAYYDWSQTLEIPEQARLSNESNLDERLKKISSIKIRQIRENFGRTGATKLPFDRDAEHLYDWYELSINSKENQIRERFPFAVSQYERQNNLSTMLPVSLLKRFAQRQPINKLVAILIRIDRTMIQDLVYEDIDLLRRGLSYEARAIIDMQSSPNEQKELVLNWIDAANQAQATIPIERLQEFYEQLPSTERDELDMMAPDNWKNTLKAKYWQYHNSQRQASPFDRPDGWEEFFNSGDEGFQ